MPLTEVITRSSYNVLTAVFAVQGVSAVKLNVPGHKQTKEVVAKNEPAEAKSGPTLAGGPQTSADLPADECASHW